MQQKNWKKINCPIILKYLKPNLTWQTFVWHFIPNAPKYSLEKKMEVISEIV